MEYGKTIIVLGNDKISSWAYSALLSNTEPNKFSIVIDKSTSFKRLYRLIIKRRLSLLLVFKMMFGELLRKRQEIIKSNAIIKSNIDLINLINKYKPQKILLFRAGLIINKKVISLGVPLMNIHCAKVPEYGGLGSIQRAIKDKVWEQNATLHQVTTTIDEGVVFDIEPYKLFPDKLYSQNENIAYLAGIKLLLRVINSGKDFEILKRGSE